MFKRISFLEHKITRNYYFITRRTFYPEALQASQTYNNLPLGIAPICHGNSIHCNEFNISLLWWKALGSNCIPVIYPRSLFQSYISTTRTSGLCNNFVRLLLRYITLWKVESTFIRLNKKGRKKKNICRVKARSSLERDSVSIFFRLDIVLYSSKSS